MTLRDSAKLSFSTKREISPLAPLKRKVKLVKPENLYGPFPPATPTPRSRNRKESNLCASR
jgi:hypothetical protein